MVYTGFSQNQPIGNLVKHLLILLSILLLSSPVIGQSSKKVDLSLLAKELMLWMQTNCNVSGVHPEHNFCNLNWNHPFPEITILPQKELSRQFRINNGTVPDGNDDAIRGFYLPSTNKIYVKDQDYSKIIYQSDIIHELIHYIQEKNGLISDCPPHYEIPASLMQIHFYRKKTGRGATAHLMKEYKKDYCNTLYK